RHVGASSCVSTTLLTAAEDSGERNSVVEPDDLALRVIRPQPRPIRRAIIGEIGGRLAGDARPLAVLDGIRPTVERDDRLFALGRHIDSGVGILRASERWLRAPTGAAIAGEGDLLVVGGGGDHCIPIIAAGGRPKLAARSGVGLRRPALAQI